MCTASSATVIPYHTFEERCRNTSIILDLSCRSRKNCKFPKEFKIDSRVLGRKKLGSIKPWTGNPIIYNYGSKIVDRYYMVENKIFWDIDVAQNVERTCIFLHICLFNLYVILAWIFCIRIRCENLGFNKKNTAINSWYCLIIRANVIGKTCKTTILPKDQ